MDKGNIIQLHITDLTDDGKGIGHRDGMAVFADGAIPGDTVRAKITRVKKRYAFARIQEMITPSEDRVEAECPHFGTCGGCALSEMSYNAQLRLKRDHVVSKLERIGGIENPRVRETIPCLDGDGNQAKRYRNKAVFAVGKSEREAFVGFRMRASNMIVNAEDCLLQKAPVMAVARAVRECINNGLITVYDAGKKKGLLREITVKACEGSGEMMVVLTVASKKIENLEEIVYAIDDAVNEAAVAEAKRGQLASELTAGALPSVPASSECGHVEAGARGDCASTEIEYFLQSVVLEVKRGDIHEPANDYVTVAGASTIKDYVPVAIEIDADDVPGIGEEENFFLPNNKGMIAFEISAPAFYQVNTRQMVKLYDKAAEYAGLEGGEVLFDIYCGIGTIGLHMADKAGMVVGIEDVKGAVLDANRNAVINGIVNARYYAGKAEDVLPRILDPEDKMYADYIANEAKRVAIVDPPRGGCDERLLRTLAEAGAERIVYISCDPGPLARDVKILVGLGYEFVEATPCDMFPETMGIETVALLEREKGAE